MTGVEGAYRIEDNNEETGAMNLTQAQSKDLVERIVAAAHPKRIILFGSAARGDSRPMSDVDLTVRLEPGFSQGGFDYFGRFEALRARLAQILACPVDLVEEPVETARLQEQIDEDRVLAF